MLYTGERPTEETGNEESKLYYELALEYVKGHVLDAACGVGYMSKQISDKIKSQDFFNQYVGGDISKEAIEHANKRYSDNGIHFFQMDVMNLDPRWNNMFDTYVSIETVEHVPETRLQDIFASAHIVLKKGGTYFMTTPDYDVIPYRPRNQSEIRGFHYRHYTAKELYSALHMFSSVKIGKAFDKSSLIVIATK